ncbi:MAG: FkbM family methyltransferase [Armatimonadota bacterium]
MKNVFSPRYIVSLMSPRNQTCIKKIRYARLIKSGKFRSPELEFDLIKDFVKEGDSVLDIGANAGTYSSKLSALVGASGRVYSFEPFPETFEILVSNAALFPYKNVTLLNIAVSDKSSITAIGLRPENRKGQRQLGRVSIVNDPQEELEDGLGAGQWAARVLCYPLDSFDFPDTIKFVKIDVEGHEVSALEGMTKILTNDKPILVIECKTDIVKNYLEKYGYVGERLPDSPNYIFKQKTE